jgi:hypothetical protein
MEGLVFMSKSYLTISMDVLKKHWSLIQSVTKGYKPIRDIEGFVLIEASKDLKTLSLRIANQQGGLSIVIGSEQPSAVTVHADFTIAISIDDLSKVIPYLKGTLDIQSVDGKDGLVNFVTGNLEQQVAWSDTMAEDFPLPFQKMQERARFVCPDLDRRLRLGGNSASRVAADVLTLAGSTFIRADGDTMVIESAGQFRGVSRMEWQPEALKLPAGAFGYLLPRPNIITLARIAHGYTGEVIITNDPGGGQIGWQFGHIGYSTRSLGDAYYPVGEVFEAVGHAEASVLVESLSDIIKLITAQTPEKTVAKATVTMGIDGRVVVTSPSTRAPTTAWMDGMCSGTLPYAFTMNAGQVVEVLPDLKNTTGLLHFQACKTGRGINVLKVTSPSDPDYIYIANLLSQVQERRVEVVEDSDEDDEIIP